MEKFTWNTEKVFRVGGNMFQDILAISMGIVVISAGVWVWWLDHGKDNKN
jgi:hypothetical protein